MTLLQKLIRGQSLREKVALLKIGRGLEIKECADQLGISYKAADYYWHTAKRQIRGEPLSPFRKE
jgi:DNA-binding CsgD family transcriptional regulator